MRELAAFKMSVINLITCLLVIAFFASGCTSAPKAPGAAAASGLSELKVEAPVTLRLKALAGRPEQVSYRHFSSSQSFEDGQLRHRKDDSMEFTSQAETVKTDQQTGRFTQVLTILKKEGQGDLHDFAMPELGEKLEVTADSRGKILKSGDYPSNSIFFVPSISIPEGPVAAGDTWAMQAQWLSLGEMVPYQLDMVSILKRFLQCGSNRCAEIEISGEVTLQGTLTQAMSFRSLWRGFLIFDIDAGTVLWSRVDSEESLTAGNVKRTVNSCLEAQLIAPGDLKLAPHGKPVCGAPEPAKQ